jgi:hypothetical protein
MSCNDTNGKDMKKPLYSSDDLPICGILCQAMTPNATRGF